MRKTRIMMIATCFIALGVFSLLAPRRAEAFNFFFSKGPFAISFGSGGPAAPAPIPVEPPAFYHPSASLYVNLDIPDEGVETEYVVPETEEVVVPENEIVEPETTYVVPETTYIEPAVVATPSVVVVERQRAVVYGPAYRTAPYLAAVPPAIRVAPKPAPRPMPAPILATPRPSANAYPGPYPVRPNPFQPSPHFGPGPHVPGPNHFGGMTPLGPGPRPAYGPH